MTATVKLTAKDGSPVEFVPDIIGQGGMKDVYFSPDKSYVVAFFRDKLDYSGQDRLTEIVGRYRDRIFNQEGGPYLGDLYCWPTKVVEWEGRTGVVAPTYRKPFFFEHGSKNNDFLHIKGKEKEGKWFASASNRNKFLDVREKGNLLSYLRICLLISRAVRRMHAAGLAHSDLSYKNVLIDPVKGEACIIDIDGLVVPGKFPPDVVGTPDFIAPEVVATQALKRGDPGKALPSIATDRHALAVLIYMYLFFRHPLRGDKVHAQDAADDEALAMGRSALFIEHPTDRSNRKRLDQAKPSELPWADTDKLPYTIAGPLLANLFERAFIAGLHEPGHRPTADDWETALVRTVDLIQPCENKSCEMQWFVFDNSTKPKCPYCGTPYNRKLPVLNLYSCRRAGSFSSDGHRLMVYDGQSLFLWHANRHVTPNEKLTAEQKRRVGYFQFHAGDWFLVNENLPQMKNLSAGTGIPLGGHTRLRDGDQILLSSDEGGRLIQVQMIEG